MSARMAFFANAAMFYVAWIIAVAGAAYGAWWAGPVAVALFAAFVFKTSDCRRADLIVAVASLIVGAISDSWLAHAQWVIYTSPVPSADFAPVWILALWVNFALTINHSLAFLKRNLYLAAGLGVIGAPVSYYFAARTWHAIALAQPTLGTLLVIGAIWLVVTPLLAFLARRLDAPPTARAAVPATESAH